MTLILLMRTHIQKKVLLKVCRGGMPFREAGVLFFCFVFVLIFVARVVAVGVSILHVVISIV